MPKKAPELVFQQHVAHFLQREHGYGVLRQDEITDTEHAIAEDHLWTFLSATQADTLQRLAHDYGTDAREEVMRALRRDLEHTPLWMLLRDGLRVRGLSFRLFYPRPRSAGSVAAAGYAENRITFRPHFYFGETGQEIDLVLFLNGLPIVAVELKHEKNQTVHDAVAQFARRDHTHGIFQHPFLYLAADTSEVMAATDPRHAENFRWHNTGLLNEPRTDGEYPVEFLYREVLSADHLLEALSFFLVRVPRREASGDRPARPASTILPRYHQSRMVRRVADDALAHFAATGNVGKKYLVQHSAGSGKTLSICWLADRLHSLYRPGTGEKLVDMVFILTDRKSLDTNIRDDLENFTHLRDVVGLSHRADDLVRFLQNRQPIIVTTQQKFAWVLDEIAGSPALKELRVAFLIDEAHRSQEGRMGAAIRVPFRRAEEPDAADAAMDEADEEERVAQIIREHDLNQLFVAFTATPAPATVQLFGAPFDRYTEAEAITEGYIVDVATSIISYRTLYHLHCPVVPDPQEEKRYPAGVVARALQNVAFQDDELIQYKSEVMLRIFEEQIKPLVGGRAKAMIVATSRVAGLRYFEIIREKLRERGAEYRVLYAFSDFVHPHTDATVTEHAINDLGNGERIEERFEGDDYRLMVVANKFQTGFDQPLLAGMFLDRPVAGRNAVQTVSRLNRSHPGKDGVVVVDFTNNAAEILSAFAQYRGDMHAQQGEPDPAICMRLLEEVLERDVFSQQDANAFAKEMATGTDAQVQYMVSGLRQRFQDRVARPEDRRAFVNLLARFAKSFRFMTCFFTYPAEVGGFASFAEYVGPQLVKEGGVSELMQQVRRTEVVKAAVEFKGAVTRPVREGKARLGTAHQGEGPPPTRVTVQDVIAEIQAKYAISDEEALYIRKVTEEKVADPNIRETVQAHREDRMYLEGAYRGHVNSDIRRAYDERARYEELADPRYTDTGGIFDIMAMTVIQRHLASAA